MNIQRKIEEIRQKPEHIRLRYTYAAVAVSMFFILILWFFSLSENIRKTRVDMNKQNVFDQAGSQKKSLKEATDNIKSSLDNINNTLQSSPTPGQTGDRPAEQTPLNNTTTQQNPPTGDNNTQRIPPTTDQAPAN